MKVGNKVFCKDGRREFTGWIANIDNSLPYPYSIVKNRKDVGKSYDQLDSLYGDNRVFDVFKLRHLRLIQDNTCQHCDLTRIELEVAQSELKSVYAMLQNRDNKIRELERELKLYESFIH